jgi:hypothetical protein
LADSDFFLSRNLKRKSRIFSEKKAVVLLLQANIFAGDIHRFISKMVLQPLHLPVIPIRLFPLSYQHNSEQ